MHPTSPWLPPHLSDQVESEKLREVLEVPTEAFKKFAAGWGKKSEKMVVKKNEILSINIGWNIGESGINLGKSINEVFMIVLLVL